jgi:hypothetical protein
MNYLLFKVGEILSYKNWHPLEREELPDCVYNEDIPYELDYLDSILNDQITA